MSKGLQSVKKPDDLRLAPASQKGRQSMGVRVDTYANVKANLQAVTDVLVNGGMPPTGPLPEADRQFFQTWVDQGALNN
jgi:hypothetical protein